MNLNKGLIAYYPFNGNANDASGNGNDGIPMNGVQLTTDRFGNPNSAYHFDGVDDYILVNDNGKLSPKSITVAAYVNTEITAGQCVAGKIDHINGNASAYFLGINYDVQTGFFFGMDPAGGGSCFQQYPYSPTLPYAKSNGDFSIDAWHCIVGTSENGIVKIYVDGVLANTVTSPVPDLLQCSNTQFEIGSWWANDLLPFKGSIDEVRVYNRALTADEVSALCMLQGCTPLQGNLTGSNICAGKAGMLTFENNNTTGPFTLTYTDGIGNYTQTNVVNGVPFATALSPTANTMYTLLSILDTTNCPITLTTGNITQITVENPSITAAPDTTICPGALVQFRADGAASYTWSPATALSDPTLADPIAHPVTTTSYIVTGTTPNGCISEDTIKVAIFPALVTIHIPDAPVCPGYPVQLMAEGGTGFAWTPAQYLDNPGIFDPIARPLQTTRFILTSTDINQCNETDSVTISILPVPVYQAPPDKLSVCKGSSVMLGVKGPVHYRYAWSPVMSLDDPSSPTPLAVPALTTLYTEKVSDSLCAAYDSSFSVTVSVLPTPVFEVQKANDIDCSLATSQLIATGTANYSWTPAQGLSDSTISDPIASIDSTTTFIVRGTDQDGCSAFDTLTVKVTAIGANLFIVPNAFSPNGDGHNDCFGISKWGDVKIREFIVFDRWGMPVFTTHDPSVCWDGNFMGKPQETGVYAYVIKVWSICGEVTRTGTVMLIR